MMDFFKPYDPAKDNDVEVKRQRANKISADINRENSHHESKGSGGKGIFAIILIAIMLTIFALNAKAGDRFVFVDTTYDGRAIFEKAPDYVEMQFHYLDVIEPSMEAIQSDSLDQEELLYNFYNIGMQCIFANRLPDQYWITPYNMISRYIDDPDLRYKLTCLVNNYNRLAPSSASFTLGHTRYKMTAGQWYCMTSEADLRPISFDEMVCQVMDVKYSPPVPIDISTIAVVETTKRRNLSGYATVEP